ncbi:MAG: sulfotransferase [Deltaproteobacteria bacterium]|nr:sulfotransferase [Deltaproteobacteria bacterium]
MKVEKPIFIVGVGRSGSTVFHRIFSEHPNVAWLSSRLCNRFPNKPSVNSLLMRTIDFPLIGGFIRRRFVTGEGYVFWEQHCRGFSEPCRDLLAADVTHRIKREIPSVLSSILTKQRNRLLIKITGWPRISFLHEIFHDAKFIHINRDRRAVINSLINVDFWSGWQGPQNWRWGKLTLDQIEEWERFDRSFIALAGIELKILSEAMEKGKRCINIDNFIEIDYADLCGDPLDTFKEIVEFCELKWSLKFEDRIKKYSLKNTNHKWQEELTSDQQKIAEYFIDGY